MTEAKMINGDMTLDRRQSITGLNTVKQPFALTFTPIGEFE